MVFSPILNREVFKLIQDLKNKKSTVEDGVTNEMLKIYMLVTLNTQMKKQVLKLIH